MKSSRILEGCVAATVAKLRAALKQEDRDKAAEDLASMLQRGFPCPTGETRAALWSEYLAAIRDRGAS